MRFNQVFYLLLMLSAISAFMLPQGMTDRVRPLAGTLLTPVAEPTRALSGWMTGRAGPSVPVDQRPADQIVLENVELKQTVAKLQHDLDVFRKRDAEHAKLGDIRDLCRPVTVLGPASSGGRDVLTVRSSSLTGLADKMVVLYEQDIVGVLANVGAGGAQVRLVTDPQSRMLAKFGVFQKPTSNAAGDGGEMRFVPLAIQPMLVEGAGGGKMICRNIPWKDATDAGLVEGAWAILNDAQLPTAVQGRRLGVVRKIAKGAKMMAEIEIRPEIDLMQLKEVMVLTKDR